MRDALRAAARHAGLPRRRRGSGWSRPARRCAPAQAEALAAHAPALGGRRRGPAARARSSWSPTSSSTRCRSASSSAPTRSGASGWSRLDGGRLAFAWGPPRPDAGLDARFPLLPDGDGRRGQPGGRGDRRARSARASPGDGGAALVVDYGAWDGTGDTLQALRGARARRSAGRARRGRPDRARPLPRARRGGAAGAGARAGAAGGVPRAARHHRPGAGAGARRRRGADAVAAAHRRLTHPDEMGNLFQVLALTPEDAPPPPGFDP